MPTPRKGKAALPPADDLARRRGTLVDALTETLFRMWMAKAIAEALETKAEKER